MAISKEKQEILTAERKRQITQSAMELFDLHGFRNTKISDIAAHAGISKGLVYHYYSTKEELLLSTKDALLQCVDECARKETAEACLRLFAQRLVSIPYFDNYIPPIRIIFHAAIQGDLPVDTLEEILGSDFVPRYFGALFRRGQKEGTFREGDPLVFANVFWNWLVGCMVEVNLSEGKAYHPDIDMFLSLFRVQS